jgi:hypothetical protein
MKSYTVLATFPTLPAKVAQQAATAEATTAPTAVSRALETIMKRDGVRGRRVEQFTLRVSCNGKVSK